MKTLGLSAIAIGLAALSSGSWVRAGHLFQRQRRATEPKIVTEPGAAASGWCEHHTDDRQDETHHPGHDDLVPAYNVILFVPAVSLLPDAVTRVTETPSGELRPILMVNEPCEYT